MASQTQPWELRRQDARIAINADQAEFAAVHYGTSNIEAGTFDDRVAGALDDYEVPDPRISVPAGQWDWASHDMALDNAVSDIGIELRRRKEVLGGLYPFVVADNQLVYSQSRTLAYEFCLAVTQAPSLSKGDFTRLPIAFERLVRDILIRFLGPGAQGIRTGWPPDAHEPRPAHFKELIAALHNATNEWEWAPEIDLPKDPDPQDVKDEGLDFVIWKEIPDRRPGRLFLLGQCACGKNYDTKFGDIDARLDKLSKWIRPIPCVFPVRVFATPHQIPNDTYFRTVNRQAGWTLDRSRITLLAESEAAREYVVAQARDPYASLIRLVIEGFEADQPKRGRQPRKAAAGRRSRSPGT